MKNCEYGYRKPGDVSVHCRLLMDCGKNDYCAHQYLCRVSNRWEVSNQGKSCPVKNKANQSQ